MTKPRAPRRKRHLHLELERSSWSLGRRALATSLEENHRHAMEARELFEERSALFRRTVREARASGLTPTKIARIVGISRGRVHQILS